VTEVISAVPGSGPRTGFRRSAEAALLRWLDIRESDR